MNAILILYTRSIFVREWNVCNGFFPAASQRYLIEVNESNTRLGLRKR